MKEILRLAGVFLVLMVMGTAITMLLFAAILSDIRWLSVLLTIVLLLSIYYVSFLEGAVEGRKARMFEATMRRQEQDRGVAPTEAEKARFFAPWKGFAAAYIAALPGIVLSILMLFLAPGSQLYFDMTPIIRLILSLYMGTFSWLEGLMPYIYLPLSLVLPSIIGLGYLFGPKFYDRMMKQIEESKRKRRRRRRKKTTGPANPAK